MTSAQLKNELERAGLTARRLAAILGLSERTMYRYTSGSQGIPKHLAIAVLCVTRRHAAGKIALVIGVALLYLMLPSCA